MMTKKTQPPEATERLQKALARAGVGSRRACEGLIAAGRVRVNGDVATLGDRVDTSRDVVTIDGHRVPLDPSLRYIMLNKPAGVVTTMEDPQGRMTISDLIPGGERVFPVGRLDMDTEGLLLLTNDGELANRLMHPSFGVEKEYLAEVEGEVHGRHVRALRRGVELEDGPARPLRSTVIHATAGRSAIEIVMGEGRKREVRRMLAAVGLPVVRLVRVRQGPLRLSGVRPGETRDLTPAEVAALYESAGL
jgi:23S rRNA pseudouridine2605 synthase